MVRIVTLVQQDAAASTGLPNCHPLVTFSLNAENIDVALTLDDAVIWGALTQLTAASDTVIATLSKRLRDRALYKCIDIRLLAASILDPLNKETDELIDKIDRCCIAIKEELSGWIDQNKGDCPRVLIDATERSPYKPISSSKGPLDRINIRTDGGKLVDLSERSSVVAALKAFKLMRAYVDPNDQAAVSAVNRIVNGEIEKCRA